MLLRVDPHGGSTYDMRHLAGIRCSTWALAAVLASGVGGGAGSAWATEPKPPKTELHAFKPVADAYVAAARPRANFGTGPVLRVDGAPETTAFLRFDLKRIRGEVVTVTLLLHAENAAGSRYAVRRVSDHGWRERRLTYANAPELSRRYASSRPVRRGTWSAVDVTSFVDDGGGKVGFAITTRGTRELRFGSRESRHGPRLVVRSESEKDDDGAGDAPPAVAH